MQPGPTQCTIGDQLGVATGQKPQDKFLPINQLDALAVDLCRVASLVQRLGRVSSSPAPIPLKYCNLLICLFTGVQWVSNSFSDSYSKLN